MREHTACRRRGHGRFAAVVALIVILSAGLVATAPVASAELSGTWTATGNLLTPRTGHTATLLADGRVLVTGGNVPGDFTGALAAAEIFNPATGTWTATGSMTTPRKSFTATRLPDGRVLVAGGIDASFNYLNSAEIFDPATGAWTATGAMSWRRSEPSAVALPDGRVLVAGGEPGGAVCDDTLTSTEIFDPATGTWTAAADTLGRRLGGSLTLLNDGRVLYSGGGVAGGGDYCGEFLIKTAELFDPSTGQWSATGSSLAGHRGATRVGDGTVLAIDADTGTRSTETYNPATGTWTRAGDMASERFGKPALVTLPDGRALISGNQQAVPEDTGAEIYNPASRTWQQVTPMNHGREGHTATLLANGTVLVAGGGSGGIYDLPTEIFCRQCDFTLTASPASLTIVRGGASASTAITIQPSGGFSGQITLTTSGVPAGISVTPAAPVTVSPDVGGTYPSTSLTFAATATATPGSYTVTITGTGGGLSHLTTLTLQVKRK